MSVGAVGGGSRIGEMGGEPSGARIGYVLLSGRAVFAYTSAGGVSAESAASGSSIIWWHSIVLQPPYCSRLLATESAVGCCIVLSNHSYGKVLIGEELLQVASREFRDLYDCAYLLPQC